MIKTLKNGKLTENTLKAHLSKKFSYRLCVIEEKWPGLFYESLNMK